MDASTEGAGGERSRSPTVDDLIKLCRRLNELDTAYLVVGGWAMIHHGALRPTEELTV